MKLIEEALIEYFGERCLDYAEGCPTCEAWAEFDSIIKKMRDLQIQIDLLESDIMEGY